MRAWTTIHGMIGPRAVFFLFLAVATSGCGKREPVAEAPALPLGTVQGTIVDERGQGVPGVDVAPRWDPYSLTPLDGTRTDREGNYSLRAPAVSWDPDRIEVYAIDAKRSHGAVITHFKDTRSPRTTLRPLVTARVRLDATYAGPVPEKTLLRIERRDGGEILRTTWRGPLFDLRVPPGTYRVYVEGEGLEGFSAMTLDPAPLLVDYPVVTLKPKGGWRTSSVIVTGCVIDPGGRLVPNAELARRWHLELKNPQQEWRTDAQGNFNLELNFDFRPGEQSDAILCVDKDRKLGGILIATPAMSGTPQTLQLRPLVTLRADLDPGPFQLFEKTDGVSVSPEPHGPIASASWKGREFVTKLPPGTYSLSVVGHGIQHYEPGIVLREGVSEVNLGTIKLKQVLPSGSGR